MKTDLENALDKAEKKMEDALAELNKKHDKAIKNSTPEPDVLRSGTFDEVGLRRSIKEQKNEKLP